MHAPPFRHLLIPLDPGALAEPAMRMGIDLARQLGAAVTAFVAEPPAPEAGFGHGSTHYVEALQAHTHHVARHAQDMLTAFELRAEEAGVPFVGLYAQTARIDAAIADTALHRGCDLIVMVTHGRGTFGALLFGSRTKAVMARTKLPVLVLR